MNNENVETADFGSDIDQKKALVGGYHSEVAKGNRRLLFVGRREGLLSYPQLHIPVGVAIMRPGGYPDEVRGLPGACLSSAGMAKPRSTQEKEHCGLHRNRKA